MATFLRYFLMVGLTTTLVMAFLDTREGKELLARFGLPVEKGAEPRVASAGPKRTPPKVARDALADPTPPREEAPAPRPKAPARARSVARTPLRGH
jgi:hypothetical protein